MKQCCTCKVHKDLSAFTKDKSTKDGLKYRCRECRKAKEHDPVAKAEYNKRYWQSNKAKIAPKAKAYRTAHAVDLKAYQQRYRDEHRAELAKYRKDMAGYMKAYNQAYKPRKNEWVKSKRSEDANFRMACNLRGRFHSFVKGDAKTFDVLGMSMDVFRQWIQCQFEPGMTWDTYSVEWELNHVLPVSSFDLDDPLQQHVCFGWTNFQPKFIADNRAKGNALRIHEFFNSFITAHRFITKQGLGRQEYQRLRESVAWLRAKISGTVTNSWMSFSGSEMGNQQPSSYGRHDEPMEKVQRLDGCAVEEPRQLL